MQSTPNLSQMTISFADQPSCSLSQHSPHTLNPRPVAIKSITTIFKHDKMLVNAASLFIIHEASLKCVKEKNVMADIVNV
jgi:hypothetical protein